MSVILVSSDSPDSARKISTGVAQRLGYRTLGRELLAEVARAREIDEAKLVRSLEKSTGLLGLSEDLRRRSLAYIQEAVLSDLVKDGVVCHELAAHLYVFDVAHVLKVRILPDVDQQARDLAELKGISVDKARRAVDRAAVLQRRWSKSAYGLDATDPSLYDLVIKTSQIGAERAAEIIADTVRDPAFRPMTYSRKRLADLLLECRVRSVLIESVPGVRVQARDGHVLVQLTALKRQRQRRAAAVQVLASGVSGIGSLEVEIVDDDLAQAAESLR
jgi:cytidylate kinase